MRRMPITDAFFLLAESRRTPMHVGGLNLFTLPKDVDDTTFLANLSKILRYDGELRRPFHEKLKLGPLGLAGNIFWEEEDEIDMDYHIRHSALPKPGRYRELFALVSRLHSTLLDRSRPLWEMHLIEGLPNRQFATYFKAHHCAVDGVGSMHLMSSMYSTNARSKVKISPFSREAYELYKKQLAASRIPRATPKESEVRAVTELLRQQLGGTVNVARALRETAEVWLGRNKTMAVPFHKVPRSAVSTQITGARRFVAQSWPFARVRAVGKAFDGTLNDAVMAMCAGALRRHLQEQRDLPKISLKAMAPVSLRAAGDVDSANAVGMVIADLATNVRDPAKRFRAIKASMDASKTQLQQMTPGEIQVYTGITQAPLLLGQLTGMSSRFPAFSTVISNVPGPREKRYWNGARLEGMYPVSIPMDGAAVNFTLVSNFENLDFGIVACRKSVPQVQRMIDYMEESLVELEDAAGLRRRGGRARGPLQRLEATETGAGGKQKKAGATRRKKKAPAVPQLKARSGARSPAQPKRATAGKAAGSKTSNK
ncbi:MAG: wax ester/triacylglycerol synthase family O-acyltransferase [Pseudomonadales bacterium]|nr:wax ester/triacylglycerol synthase family O-acyltransferase [Pseudomonadales bacterium]